MMFSFFLTEIEYDSNGDILFFFVTGRIFSVTINNKK